MTLAQHWNPDPALIAVLVVALVHARGVRRLTRHSPPARARSRRREAFLFDVGLLVVVLAVGSPLDYYADEYLFVHMLQHLLLLFAAPAALVAGAPWVPLEFGAGKTIRRAVRRALRRAVHVATLRRVGRALTSPWTAVVGLNAVVVFWHLPGPLDLAEENALVHVVLMHGSFLLIGIAFFLQLVNSRPFSVRISPQAQMVAIFATAVVFWLFAMALGLFAKHAVYPWYRRHEGPGLSPFADQQIAAGVMWVCGDFWAIPAMVRAVRRLTEERPRRPRTGGGPPLPGRIAGFNLVGRAHARAKLLDALRERERPIAPAPELGGEGVATER